MGCSKPLKPLFEAWLDVLISYLKQFFSGVSHCSGVRIKDDPKPLQNGTGC